MERRTRTSGLLVSLSIACVGAQLLGACSSDATSGSSPTADDSGASPSDAGNEREDAGVLPDGSTDRDAATTPDGSPSTPDPSCDGVSSAPTWDYVDPATLPDFNATGPGDAPTARGLNGVAYGNGRFVTIGIVQQQGRLLWLTSDDGVTWTKHEQALPDGVKHGTLKAVHYIQGKFVFFGKDIGTGFRVYTSSDGLSWDATKIDDTGSVVENFVSDGTTTVLVGPSNSFYKSTDLVHWTPSTGVTSGSFGYNTIAFGAGHWVAGTNTSTAIFSSTDATTWTPQNDVAHNLRIVFGRDMFVGNSGDGLFTSADGTQFTKKATTGLVNGGIGYFSGGRFLFLSQLLEPPYTNQKVDVSTDGVTYTEFGKIEGHPGPAVYDVAFGKCRYVIAGWWLSGNDYKPYIVSRAAAPAP